MAIYTPPPQQPIPPPGPPPKRRRQGRGWDFWHRHQGVLTIVAVAVSLLAGVGIVAGAAAGGGSSTSSTTANAPTVTTPAPTVPQEVTPPADTSPYTPTPEPIPTPTPEPTPTPPSTPAPSSQATQVSVWLSSGGSDHMLQVGNDVENIGNAQYCLTGVPLSRQLISDAQAVIDHGTASGDPADLPASTHTPLDAAMRHLQDAGQDMINWCAAPAGSAQESYYESKGRADLAAATTDLQTATREKQRITGESGGSSGYGDNVY